MQNETSTIWQEIESAEIELLKSVQDAVKSQCNEWQKIPALAWKADRLKPEHSTDLKMFRTALFGLWPISIERPFWNADFWIDCATGAILSVRNLKEVQPEELRPLWGNLELLDAERVIQKIEKEISRNSNPFTNLPECIIPTPYVRKEPLPETISTQLVECAD